MTSPEDWCAEKLSKLLDEDLRISALNEIKDHLTSIPPNEVSHTANILDLPLVFDCLNVSNTEQVDLACEVLNICLNNLKLGDSTNRYGVSLERALIHPYPGVKLMALKEIERNISNANILEDLCKRKSMIINIVNCIGDNDLAVVKNASEIIKDVGISIVGIKQLTSFEVSEELHKIMSMNEVVRLRVYEVVIEISINSYDSFKILKSTGLITQILDEIDNNDVLFKLNIIELLSKFSLCDQGYLFLEECRVLHKLFDLFDDNDPLTLQLIEPGILKLFGNLAHKKSMELFNKYPKILNRVLSNIETGDVNIIGISLDTLGYIGVTNEGKCALDSTGNKIKNALQNIVKSLTSLPTEQRVRALNCLENLLRVDTPNNQISEISRKWFLALGDNPVDVILRYSKNPFAELRLAGFGILNAISSQRWGQEVIGQTPGLVEFLLDRQIETAKSCKEAKYGIVKLLSNSSVFDHSTIKRLQCFIQEGPFYVQAVTEVAIEGND